MEATADTRTAYVTLKTLSGLQEPRAIRFAGQNFADLKARLAEVHFPGYAEDSFVEVMDENQEFVCFLDTDALPTGIVFVDVHNYTEGLNMQKPHSAEHAFRSHHGHHGQPEVELGVPQWRFHHAPGHGHGHHHAHGHGHGHHHHKEGKRHHKEEHGRSISPADFRHHSEGRLGSGRHHEGHVSHEGFHDNTDRHYGHGHDKHSGHGHDKHGKHRHSGRHSDHSPTRKGHRGFGFTDVDVSEGRHGHRGSGDEMRGGHSGGEEGRHYGRWAHYGGCKKGGGHPLKCGGHGMKGRRDRSGSPRGCRMRAFGGHPMHRFHSSRGRSPSPSGRKFERGRRNHYGEDLMPEFSKMTLDCNDECQIIDLACQEAIARSYGHEDPAYTEARGGSEEEIHGEDWQDIRG